jgi:hypothetical protein
MAQYTYLVGNLLTGVLREEMPFGNVVWSPVLDRPGSFSATIPYNHPKATRANIDPGRTVLYVVREGVIVWSGIIWTARRANGASVVTVGAEGFLSYFRQRSIRKTLAYAHTDQLTIGRGIIEALQSPSLYPGGNIGIQVDTVTCGVQRDRTYWWYEYKNAGDALEELSAVQGGFDFEFASAYESGSIVNRLHFFWPKKGVRSGVVFELGTNVNALGWSIDGKALANHVDAIGSGTGATMLTSPATNTSQLGVYPLLEAQVSAKDVSVPSTLAGMAQAALAAQASADAISSIVVRSTADTQPGAFATGDQVLVRSHDGFVAIDGWYRVMAYAVTISDQGTESIDITLAAVESFA